MFAQKLVVDLNETEDPETALKIRLLHVWGYYDQKNPAILSAYCSLWTDSKGTLIQAIAPPNLAHRFGAILQLVCVYLVARFRLEQPQAMWRTCSYRFSLVLSQETIFEDVTMLSPGFCADSFEFVPFNSLQSLPRSTNQLIDVVGKVVSIAGLSCSVTSTGAVVRRKLVIQNERNIRLNITICGDVARSLDGEELAYLGRSGFVILGVCSLQITNDTTDAMFLASTPATRFVLEPSSELANVVRATSPGGTDTIRYYPSCFSTSFEEKIFRADSTKTVMDLIHLSNNSMVDATKYHCLAQVLSAESSRPWFYLGCAFCFKTAREIPGTNDFLCDEHGQLMPQETENCYKIHLAVRDTTGSACFVALGKTAGSLIGFTANELLVRHPQHHGHFPPEIVAMNGRWFSFDVQLPKPGYLPQTPLEFTVLSAVDHRQPQQ
ncbi:unnamed protein product [Linum trigynum]|uniref:Replication factor A C-terminal domain-containing protein n=1 Tax=Linum trigynum TaxID=586398 RepID=A0AAV2GMG1_9ROSI